MSISHTPGSLTATTSVSAPVTGPAVTALRWYMRIAGGLMLLFMAIPGDPSSSTLFTYVANHGPFIVPALAAIVGSFEKRANWLLGVTLTLMWTVLGVIFVFGGPDGPGLVFEIVGAIIVGVGVVISALSFRAFASGF